MTTTVIALIVLIVLALTIYRLELERSHQPQARLAGSVDVQDRDADRVYAELRAAVDRRQPTSQPSVSGRPRPIWPFPGSVP